MEFNTIVKATNSTRQISCLREVLASCQFNVLTSERKKDDLAFIERVFRAISPPRWTGKEEEGRNRQNHEGLLKVCGLALRMTQKKKKGNTRLTFWGRWWCPHRAPPLCPMNPRQDEVGGGAFSWLWLVAQYIQDRRIFFYMFDFIIFSYDLAN